MGVDVIHILGASGSGTTTLGIAISERYGYIHLDTDDFFWEKTDIPFTVRREKILRQNMLSDAVTEAGKCVISGSLCGWGDVFISRFDLVIYISAPAEIRKKRLIDREFNRFGNRILPGGDMYDEHIKFIEWAMAYDTADVNMRSAKLHEEWLKQFTCPVIRLNGTDTCEHNFNRLGEYLA
jgi:adenylate kinase family enzyme